MTERADHLYHDNAPAHFTAIVQAFLADHHITQFCPPPLQPRFSSVRLLACPKAKIAVEKEKICECGSHTVHRLGRRRLAADWLAPRESDCSWTHSGVSSDCLPGCIGATRPVLEMFRMA